MSYLTPSSARAACGRLPRRLSIFLFPLCAALTVGCAGPRPYYSGFHFETPPLVESDRSRLVVHLDAMIRDKKVKRLTVVTPDKGAQSIYPLDESSPPTIDWLPLPVLWASRFILNPKYKGIEVDLVVETAAEGYTPVTALAEVDGSIRIEMGAPAKTLVPTEHKVRRQDFRGRFGIGPVIDTERKWQPLELYSLEQALSLLSSQERAAISGVSFVRKRRAETRSKGLPLDRVWGQYYGRIENGDQRQIYLFDTKGRYDTALFIGDPNRPFPITTMCLLHEIGHAIADYARMRVFYVREQEVLAHKLLIDKWNSLLQTDKLTEELAADLESQLAVIKAGRVRSVERLEEIERQYEEELGPVHAAYRRIRGNEKGPTPYGRMNVKESFAESFALYKADPAALRRIAPDIYAWFVAGGHIQALRETMGEDVLPLDAVHSPTLLLAKVPTTQSHYTALHE